jgi:predicted phage terminase large subunit-like protein
LFGGRGAGKTEGGADHFDTFMVEHPGSRGRIIGPTLGDVFEACIDGPSGLRSVNPAVKVLPSAPGGSKVVWPNSSEAVLLGTHSPADVERLRATGNRDIDWWEEAAANRNLAAAWDQAAFGLRTGPWPHSILTTTPRNVRKLRELLAAKGTVVTRGTINDNPYLNENVKAALVEQYRGTRIGRQELEGELLTDVPGALWTWAMIEQAHTTGPVPDMVRVVVAIDPAVTSHAESDETGIIVCGKGVDGRGYVLADYSCRLSPDGWARRAVKAFDDHGADRIVAETNNGGDLVETVIRTVRQMVPYTKITASRGKAIRAEPVAALFEQERITILDGMGELEAQLTEWSPEEGESPDRLDAMVWAFHELGFCREVKRWSMV